MDFHVHQALVSFPSAGISMNILLKQNRGEDPVGDWTIKVSDQKTPKENGTFHGWSMMFWGSAIDPDKTSKFEIQPDDNLLPPSLDLNAPTVTVHPTSTKTHTKSTLR